MHRNMVKLNKDKTESIVFSSKQHGKENENISIKVENSVIQILPCMAPPWYSGSVLDHRSMPPVFESRRGHI